MAVVSIAHLSDAEREFFMSLLLSELVSYTRAQSGTSSLRALVYIDELFGFLPPVAEPATKKPLMTLLKQARAFGVGLALATQNPVDLDYKALTNAGTWFIGRLQTERDKARLIDGLTTAAPGGLSSSQLGDLISSLSMRTFLLHNVHASGPLLFQTRWVMSYMAGPLTREQIRRLSEESRVAAPPTAEPAAETSGVSATAAADTSPAVSDRPFVRPEVPERFLRPVRGASAPSYFPLVLGAADVHYASKAYGVDLTRRITLTTELSEGLIPLDWNEGDAVDVPLEALEEEPLEGVNFRPLPDVALDAKAVKSWTDLFQRWLRVEGALSLMRHAGLKLVSEPGENERDFRVRCAQLLREQRDTAREKLRQKYTSKLTTLERRRLQRQQAVERTSQQAQQRSLDAAVTIGGTLLDAFLRRKAPSSTSIGTAVRRTTGIDKQRGDVARAKEALDQTAEEIAALQAELEAELDALAASRINADELELESVSVKPTSRDVVVRYVGLVWAPFETGSTGRWQEAWDQ